MKTVEIQAEKRDGRGKGVSRKLRVRGDLPAVLYGAGKDPEALALNTRAIRKIISSQAGDRTILNLKIDGESDQLAMIKDVQMKSLTGTLLHLDMMRISEDKKIEITIPVRLKNVEDIRRLGGVVQQLRDEITVLCLPQSIPDEVIIDLADHKVGDSIHVNAIVLGDDVVMVDDPDEVLVSVLSPRLKDEVDAETPVAAEPAAEAAPKERVTGRKS